MRLVLLVVTLVSVLGLGFALFSLPQPGVGLQQRISQNMSLSGVSHPVTAVLLNFRGYDTMLELVVLLLAWLGVRSIPGVRFQLSGAGIVYDIFTRILLPLLILIAAYLLWVGAYAPGGAFQAGSLLAAAAVLAMLNGWRFDTFLANRPIRFIWVAGVVAFIAVSLATLAMGLNMLQYPPAAAGFYILVLELSAAVAIGLTLAALFHTAPPSNKDDT